MTIHRGTIIDTALVLVDESGLDALSMRRLADALKIQAPSLYWHFPNKLSLLEGMADLLMADVAGHTPPDEAWSETLRRVGAEIRQGLLSRRDGARIFAGTFVATENILRVGEVMISALRGAGASAEVAVWGAFSVVYYVLGFAMEEQALSGENAPNAANRQAMFLALAREKFPQTFAVADAVFDEDLDARFALGLDAMVAGLAGRLG